MSVDEARVLNAGSVQQELHQINHLKIAADGSEQVESATGLTIVLRATAQLNANPTAKQAFINAAAKWETLIKDPITVNIDVDFGTTFFGTAFDNSNILGQTQPQLLANLGNYPDLRQRLVNHATGSEGSVYNALPTGSVPTDTGNIDTVFIASPLMRALGLLPPVASDSEMGIGPVPRIGFNSAFGFDFDPSNGISSNLTDFDAVAVHEMGHVLGFNSFVGVHELDPSGPLAIGIWDLFRFRPGTANLNNFSTAQRILHSGGNQIHFSGGPELGLSTGLPDGSSGDQASHWLEDDPPNFFIGIMDPSLMRGVRETMTNNDENAIDIFGFTIVATVGPPNDNFANAQLISGSSGTVNGTNTFASRETGEPTFPAGTGGGRSVWYNWTAPGTGQATFDTIGSDYDTILAIYTGSPVNALNNLAANDDIDPPGAPEPRNIQSRVIFNATAGTTYRIQVDGFDGAQGSVTLHWSAPGVPTPSPSPTPGPNTVQFSASTASATETLNATTHVDLLVTRTGNTVAPAKASYTTSNATASDRSDYEAAAGTLTFAAGETSKIVPVFIVDDAFGEGPETFNVTLSDPVSCTLGSPMAVTVTINSNEAVNGTNPVNDATFNSEFFVRQHYLDFFNREPDAGGLAFWKNQIDECETRPPAEQQACREVRRINVSAAFFLSIEFQQTGYLVYKTYQAAYDRHEFLKLRDFLPDIQEIGRGVVIGQPGADALLEANKVKFFNSFVQSTTFLAPVVYPTTMTAAQFVDKLNANTYDPNNPGGGSLTPAQRDALVAQLSADPSSATLRAQVLRSIAENSVFHNRQFNKAFVLMQYFGYLRRNPNDPPELNLDYGGYNFWLGKLNQFNGNFVNAEMVKAFITSGEYLQRFGP
jgi:hypothetical protein